MDQFFSSVNQPSPQITNVSVELVSFFGAILIDGMAVALGFTGARPLAAPIETAGLWLPLKPDYSFLFSLPGALGRFGSNAPVGRRARSIRQSGGRFGPEVPGGRA